MDRRGRAGRFPGTRKQESERKEKKRVNSCAGSGHSPRGSGAAAWRGRRRLRSRPPRTRATRSGRATCRLRGSTRRGRGRPLRCTEAGGVALPLRPGTRLDEAREDEIRWVRGGSIAEREAAGRGGRGAREAFRGRSGGYRIRRAYWVGRVNLGESHRCRKEL